MGKCASWDGGPCTCNDLRLFVSVLGQRLKAGLPTHIETLEKSPLRPTSWAELLTHGYTFIIELLP